MERDRFLARVRARLANVPEVTSEVPAGWAGVLEEDRVARFARELEAIGGSVTTEPLTWAASALDRWAGSTFVVTSEGDLPPGVKEVISRGGGELLRWGPASLPHIADAAQVGVTSALWGVAETGSVLLSSSPPGGRAPSLVVPTHVVFLPEARILGTTEEVFDAITGLEELPSNLMLITGPSSSSDIGMELTVGVHGPGEVHVVITTPA
jgi:hypothetical protein